MIERFQTLVRELQLDDPELQATLQRLVDDAEPVRLARALGLAQAAWQAIETAGAVLSTREARLIPTTENLAALFLYLKIKGA